jgi:hypothetical protein
VNAAAKLAAFAAALAAVLGGAALAGAAIGPDASDDVTSADEAHSDMTDSADADHGAAARPLRGLAVAQDGLRVVVEDAELRRGRAETLRFRILDERGQTVRDFDLEHEKRMHLILARRDLSGFQHLHPEQAADGSWTTRVRVDAAGSYRLFADFAHDGTAYTLATELRVDGAADLRPLPAPRATAVSDGGYDVRLESGDARPGEPADLRFTITKDGAPVDTEPYLGAGGHLVALREGDLAFLHVHPDGDSVRFAATFPTEGRYRLFLQFKHDGRVQTVAFTQKMS